MKTIYLLLFVLFFLPSCSNIQFIANENVLHNPLYEKTNVTITGDKVPFVNSIVLSKFGTTNGASFDLDINILENKTQTVIKENQVSTRIDHEIIIKYNLSNLSKNCTVLNKKQYSRFSFIPKSEGYNFGSDKSLEKLYIRNIEDNINQFRDSLDTKIEDKNCLNEN